MSTDREARQAVRGWTAGSLVPAAIILLLTLGLLGVSLAVSRMLGAVQHTWVLVPVVPADLYGLARPDGLPAGSRAFILDARYTLQVDVVPLPLRLLVGSGRALGPLALGVGALLLARLLHLAARSSTPFPRRAPLLLGLLAVAVGTAGVGAPLLEQAAAEAVVASLDHGRYLPVQATGTLQPWWALVTGAVLVLVPVFARGRHLQVAVAGPTGAGGPPAPLR